MSTLNPVDLSKHSLLNSKPAHATLTACDTAGVIIGIRVNSHTFLEMQIILLRKFAEVPRLTWLIALYSSGLFYFGTNENTVSEYLYW
uniref:Uncharacterized protein n=1 Tax=Wuchereria bancrofti TaxID=6293 RepID=A0A1I8EVZ8_WUCBA